MTDPFRKMDQLDRETEQLFDEIFGGPHGAIAPGCELCDPDTGRTDGDPGRAGVDRDLGLTPPGDSLPEEDFDAIDGAVEEEVLDL